MVRYLVNDAHDLMMLMMMMMMMMMGWLVEENYDANPRDGMEHIRSLLMLDMYEVSDLFEIFAEAAPNGELNFASFRQCFLKNSARNNTGKRINNGVHFG